MSGSVIVRRGFKTDENGRVHFDDIQIGWADADEKAGKRLDRRRNYAFIDDELCASVSWTQHCSGCSSSLNERGFGCRECGYHGVVRTSMFLPILKGASNDQV